VHPELEERGFSLLDSVWSGPECSFWADRLSHVLQTNQTGPLIASTLLYGARNLLSLVPDVTNLLDHSRIRGEIRRILGPTWGIVRGLYFDKPPGCSWGLPWHRDRTIAIAEHPPESTQLRGLGFNKPTTKAGVCHVEAPETLLSQMLTIRIHLDEMNATNGPLYVRPGSHRGDSSDSEDNVGIPIYCRAGSVMLMRPLLSHMSIGALPDCTQHRRIVHFELTSQAELPAPYQWERFLTNAKVSN
jgi:hypothetical protein